MQTFSFKEGIRKTVQWFEADPARMVVKEEINIFMDKVIEAYEKK